MKSYEILGSLPAYGPMHISITKDGSPFYSEGVVVRFFKVDGTEWVANFQPGWKTLSQVVALEHTSHLLVLARGICYVMSTEETSPISVFGVDYSNIFRASNNRFVLQDEIGLTIIESNGTHWHTQRISWDGLSEVCVQDNVVSGLACDPCNDDDQWIPFSYDIDTKTLTGGSYPTFESPKPWWKIW